MLAWEAKSCCMEVARSQQGSNYVDTGQQGSNHLRKWLEGQQGQNHVDTEVVGGQWRSNHVTCEWLGVSGQIMWLRVSGDQIMLTRLEVSGGQIDCHGSG